PAALTGRGRAVWTRHFPDHTGQPEENAPRLRQRPGDHRDRLRGLGRQGRDAARRGRGRGRLLHWIRHARADSRTADPRASRRAPLSELLAASAAPKTLTGYPLVHHYPQPTKSPDLMRAHEGVAGI